MWMLCCSALGALVAGLADASERDYQHGYGYDDGNRHVKPPSVCDCTSTPSTVIGDDACTLGGDAAAPFFGLIHLLAAVFGVAFAMGWNAGSFKTHWFCEREFWRTFSGYTSVYIPNSALFPNVRDSRLKKRVKAHTRTHCDFLNGANKTELLVCKPCLKASVRNDSE